MNDKFALSVGLVSFLTAHLLSDATPKQVEPVEPDIRSYVIPITFIEIKDAKGWPLLRFKAEVSCNDSSDEICGRPLVFYENPHFSLCNTEEEPSYDACIQGSFTKWYKGWYSKRKELFAKAFTPESHLYVEGKYDPKEKGWGDLRSGETDHVDVEIFQMSSENPAFESEKFHVRLIEAEERLAEK